MKIEARSMTMQEAVYRNNIDKRGILSGMETSQKSAIHYTNQRQHYIVNLRETKFSVSLTVLLQVSFAHMN